MTAAVLLTEQTVRALYDACVTMATIEILGVADPDFVKPEIGWRRTAEFLRANLPEPGDDRTAGGQVEHGPGFVVLRLDRIDPDTFPPDTEPYAQVSPAAARGIGRALYHQADQAEARTRPRT